MVASGKHKWLALALLSVVQFMLVLDIAIVNVALPSIKVDLGLLAGEPAVGDQRLRARLRRLPAPRRACRRPPRPPAHVHRRPRRVHVGVAPRGARVERAVADRRPRDAGPRRGDHLPGGAVDPDDDLRRGQGAQHRARRLGRGRRLRRRGRRPARRRLHRPPELGVDLLHQHPGRDHRARARTRAARREPRRSRAQGFDALGAVLVTGGLSTAVFGDHAGERLGLELRRGRSASSPPPSRCSPASSSASCARRTR